MSLELLPQFVRKHYEVHEWKHACAILHYEFPSEWGDLMKVLEDFRLYRRWISVGGGQKSKVAAAIDKALSERGWIEKSFSTKVEVDDDVRESPTHKIDCYKNRVALEVEWNNKDAFFDRDLNNFRLLFDLRAISIGIIITRSDSVMNIIKDIGRSKSFGPASTHISKLLPKIEGGGGGGCPLLVFGITPSLCEDGAQ